jgi:glycosyltransferase involved in cell wall biosynthesis
VDLSAFVVEHRLGRTVERASSAIADALVSTLSDIELQRRCREHGRSIVSTNFSTKAIGPRLRAMYDAVIRG